MHIILCDTAKDIPVGVSDRFCDAVILERHKRGAVTAVQDLRVFDESVTVIGVGKSCGKEAYVCAKFCNYLTESSAYTSGECKAANREITMTLNEFRHGFNVGILDRKVSFLSRFNDFYSRASDTTKWRVRNKVLENTRSTIDALAERWVVPTLPAGVSSPRRLTRALLPVDAMRAMVANSLVNSLNESRVFGAANATCALTCESQWSTDCSSSIDAIALNLSEDGISATRLAEAVVDRKSELVYDMASTPLEKISKMSLPRALVYLGMEPLL